MPPPPRAERRPVIWAFSLSKLNQLLEEVLPSYAGQAEIRVFHQGFEDALRAAEERMRGSEVDVFVSAGSNGAYLRRHAPVPVVLISPTGFDMLRALTRARRLSSRVALVTFGAVTPELEEFRDLYQLEIEQRAYRDAEEAERCVRELAARGVEVVVGPGLVTDLAEQAGLRGVFLYSRSSVCEALDRAVEIARVARVEEARREHVNTILRHLTDGVVAVDMQERIQAINPAMERLLGVPAGRAMGERVSSLAPALGLAAVIEGGEPELEGIQRLGGRTLVTSRIPIREHGVQTGAVLTCQEASAIQRVDRSLRSQHRPRRFVARHELSHLLGDSPAMRQARSLAARYARSDATVLVTGRSGTGKELAAQGIHSASRRRDRPFVAINCGAFPETLLESELFGYDEGAFTGSRRGGKPGLFEAAHTGTIFLDEIGELPLPLQTKLLRVLQEREVLRLGGSDPTPVDVRVIAATNRDLEGAIVAGGFREDLYYRLGILRLHLPALADRPGDVLPLIAHLLRAALQRQGAACAAEPVLQLLEPRLQAYPWPGNVRQLENVAERLSVLLADAEGPVGEAELRAVLPELYAPTAAAAPGSLAERSQAQILRVLAECGGNQAEAARRLGIGRTTLWRRLRDAR